MGLFTSKSFGSLAIAYWQPMALRPTLAGRLPLSALKKLIFMRTNFHFGKNLFHLVSIIFNYIIYQKNFLSREEFFQLKTGYRFWLANDLLLADEPSILEEQRGKIR